MRPPEPGVAPLRPLLRCILTLAASLLLGLSTIPPAHADSIFTREIVDLNPQLRWLYEVSSFDVALDTQGVFHIVLAEEDAIGYLRLENGERSFMEIDSGWNPYAKVDIVVTSDGTPHLIYIYVVHEYPEGYYLRHAVLEGGSWTVENVDDIWAG